MSTFDIKLIATDIDGVWTDGGMYYDQHGNELKKFHTYDSAGVLFAHKLNIPVAIITGETTDMVKRRSEKLKVDYLYQGIKDKLSVLESICKDRNITLDNVAYIGDDINDISVLKKVLFSAAPMSAPEYIKSIVDYVVPVNGGNGAFRSFVENIIVQRLQKELPISELFVNQ